MTISQLSLAAALLQLDSPVLASAARSWPLEPPVLVGLAVTGLLYGAGVARAWRSAGAGKGVSFARAAAGGLGIVALAAALASPLEPLSSLLFSAHMVQHLLLVFVAAPLLVAGVPLLSSLWLLPVRWRRGAVSRWRRSGPIQGAWHFLTHPIAATSLFVALLWSWHLPAAYEAALASQALHAVEHLSLLAGAGLFWWTLLQPMGRRRLSRFGAPLVLFVLSLQGGILGAMMTLAPRPWYDHYSRVAEALGFSALADQQLAGLLMWVPPGAVYLLLACWMLYRALASLEAAGLEAAGLETGGLETPGLEAAGFERGHSRSGVRRSIPVLLCALAATTLGNAGHAQVLSPSGPAAEQISVLFWLMLVIAAIVCLVVFSLLFVAVFRSRGPRGVRPPFGNGPFVVLGGIVVPLLILVPLMFYSLGVTAELVRPAEEPLTIEVIGHQWWWEVRYPDAGVVGANEIHIPADQSVRLQLTSADVIHSFWAPGLQGKMDLIPGTVTELWIEANRTGVYPAQCAEFCGAQHANMRLLVVSEPPESFARWLADRQEPAQPPRDPLVREGLEVFLSSACVYCHTIEGTNATGDLGPDLTHLASRMTLGAGTVANNRGNLGGWIVNSQAIKPGNRMPPMYVDANDLQALLAYLESLE